MDYIKAVVESEEYLPRYSKPGDVGVDLKAYIELPHRLLPGASAFFRSGVRVELPENVAGFVRSRSGLARDYGIVVLGDGTIDPGYRGEIGITIINLGSDNYVVNPGDRIAQLVCVPVITPIYIQAESLSDSERGENGFGSTGK